MNYEEDKEKKKDLAPLVRKEFASTGRFVGTTESDRLIIQRK
jgi:hypothetical protein